jgi:hypothetical protein
MTNIEFVKKQRDDVSSLVKVFIFKANASTGLHREKHAEIASLLDDVQITLQDYIDLLEKEQGRNTSSLTS